MHKIDISTIAQSALAIIAAVSITDVSRDIAKEMHPTRPILGACMRIFMVMIIIFAIILIFNGLILPEFNTLAANPSGHTIAQAF